MRARKQNWGAGQSDDASPATEDTSSPDTTTTIQTEYSDAAVAELLYMLEEEKLAGDIYDAFYDQYGATVFDNIAQSEDNHFDALLAQAESLGLDTDSFVFNEPGTFENPELQEMYDTLLAQGSVSLEAALEVGVAIETKDMTDIAEAAELVEGTQLEQVYDHLLTGSSYHLEAFESLL